MVAIPGLPRPGAWELRAGATTWAISALPLDTRQADLAQATSSEIAPAVKSLSRAISARIGEITNIMTSTPITVSNETMS